MVIVDVGANDGEFTKKAMETCEGAEVHAIEPNPACWPQLERLKDRFSRLTIHRVGCDAHDGRRGLQLNPNTTKGTYVPGIEPDAHGVTETPMVRLDDLIERADFVKIDAQGLDAAILRGAPRLLQTCPLWVVEVWPTGLEGNGDSVEGLYQTLTDAGLQVQWMDETPCTPDEILAWRESGRVYTNWIGVRV